MHIWPKILGSALALGIVCSPQQVPQQYSPPMAIQSIQGMSHTSLSPAHTGYLSHAIDFICDEGEPVLAAADGTVVFVKEDSDIGGSEMELYWTEGNRVVLRHRNAEYSAYEHLQKDSVPVDLGDIVRRGDLVGTSGSTGFGYWPHLHFEIFVDPLPDGSEGRTIPVYFPDLPNTLSEERYNELRRAIPEEFLTGIQLDTRP